MSAKVIQPGMLSTIQDWPGRVGYWQIGVPPSGPMDDLSFRLANIAAGNEQGTAAIEVTRGNLSIQFDDERTIAVTGAPVSVTVDGQSHSQWSPVKVTAGQTLSIGMIDGPGMRIYLAVSGGVEAEQYLGSSSSFVLGKLGSGPLRAGQSLEFGTPTGAGRRILSDEHPAISSSWDLAVTVGPQADSEFFTEADIATLYSAEYTVHFNSDRTGIRLDGPKPQWARADGGEAGLHPSNVHDNAYSIGALDFSGNTPILLGPDGPSLGGFVCPVTIVSGDRWKMGQLAPGDTVRFVPVRSTTAPDHLETGIRRRASRGYVTRSHPDPDGGVLARGRTSDGRETITYRRSGDDNILIEYGAMTLDLGLRARVYAVQAAIESIADPVITELTPGIRSLQVKFDAAAASTGRVLDMLREVEAHLPATSELVVPSRTVRLPLSWNDPQIQDAAVRYMNGVRPDAPWCPCNIEFIRRMNGLDSTDDVYRIVHDASYLVLGLGDVYLGAPVATPLDPRHRLVTTKYNPARTWTPENAVGIGGAYLCVYGMEGPGGYQLMGRTTQIWNHRHPLPSNGFDREHPWLLRYFDQIQWYPVTADELLDLRADVAAGRGSVDITDGEFSLQLHDEFLEREATNISEVRAQMQAARDEERARWAQSGEVA